MLIPEIYAMHEYAFGSQFHVITFLQVITHF